MRHLPIATKSAGCGELTTEHVQLLAGCRQAAPELLDDEAEALLVDMALLYPVDGFARCVRHWQSLAEAVASDPSTPEESDGEVLDIGRATRQWTTAMQRAIRIRDGCCQWPGCDRPPSWCDVHHCREWEHGGRTSIYNGTLLCRWHHAYLTHGIADITRRTVDDGVISEIDDLVRADAYVPTLGRGHMVNSDPGVYLSTGG